MIEIPNKIIDRLMKINLSNHQCRVLLAIMYQIYDPHKQGNLILDFKFIQNTMLTKFQISRALGKLKERRIIIQSGNRLTINEKVYQWQELSRQQKSVTISGV